MGRLIGEGIGIEIWTHLIRWKGKETETLISALQQLEFEQPQCEKESRFIFTQDEVINIKCTKPCQDLRRTLRSLKEGGILSIRSSDCCTVSDSLGYKRPGV